MKFFLFLLLAFCAIIKSEAQITSRGSGNWSDVNTWLGNKVPSITDNVIIANGNFVTLDITAACASLMIGQGSFTTLTYGTGVSLTVAGDLGIASNASLRVVAGSGVNNSLNIGGNLTNSGSLNCATVNGSGVVTDQASITFAGAANTTFSTTSASLNTLGPVTINKGTDTTSILNFIPDASAGSSLTFTSAFSLSISSGTFKIGGTRSMTLSASILNSATLSVKSRLWINNPSVTANWTGLTTLNGALQLDAGSINIGRVSGIGAVAINGGTINCTGTLNIGTYAQSAGAITLATAFTNANTAANTASFGVSGNSFIMSGGTITLQNPSTGLPKLDYNVSTPNPAITGGMLFIGNAVTFGFTNAFNLQGTTPSLSLYPGSASMSANQNPSSVTQTGALTVAGDLLLPNNLNTSLTPESFDKGIFPLTIKGNSAAHPGNITIGTGATFIVNDNPDITGPLSFTSSFGNQVFTNNGILNSADAGNNQLPSITVNNTFPGGTVKIPAGLAMLSGSTLMLTKGTLDAGASLQLGTDDPVGDFTCVRTDGALIADVVNFGLGVTNTDYTYNGTAHTSMGPELTTAASPSISTLKIDNAQGVTLNSDLTVTIWLTFATGIIDNSGNHKLSITNDGSVAVIGGSATAFLNGGTMERSQNSTAGNSYFYPVGGANKFRPVYLINGAVNGNNTFDVSYHSGAPASIAVTNSAYHVSTKDNWDIHRALPAGGADPMEVRLITNNNAASGIVDRNTVVAGHFNGNTWDNLPAQTNTGFVDETGSEIIATNVTSFSPFSFMSNVLANTLPIIVRSFEVSAINKNAAQINWSIETTSGAAIYIQQSTDGIQYNDIAHYNNGIANTSYTDMNPANGINYYRLKLVEPSGDIIYSIVKKIQFNTQSVMLYPNPAVNSIKISSNSRQVPATITIINSTGNIVYKAKTTDSQQTIDVSRFAVGQYILNYSQGDAVKHVSFVIVR